MRWVRANTPTTSTGQMGSRVGDCPSGVDPRGIAPGIFEVRASQVGISIQQLQNVILESVAYCRQPPMWVTVR